MNYRINNICENLLITECPWCLMAFFFSHRFVLSSLCIWPEAVVNKRINQAKSRDIRWSLWQTPTESQYCLLLHFITCGTLLWWPLHSPNLYRTFCTAPDILSPENAPDSGIISHAAAAQCGEKKCTIASLTWHSKASFHHQLFRDKIKQHAFAETHMGAFCRCISFDC